MNKQMYLEKLGGLKPVKNYSKTEVEFYVETMPLNKKGNYIHLGTRVILKHGI